VEEAMVGEGKLWLVIQGVGGFNSDERMKTSTQCERRVLTMKSETQERKLKRWKIVLKLPKPYKGYGIRLHYPLQVEERKAEERGKMRREGRRSSRKF
jgi:hypothetical protein